ncbi:unnamed protein product [Adineta steineri]|uniref:G-protein coupled receptors family 1 profile domain-containing protein n=1 Tax=Adineta steineri TaxID=433720 RepID=A0A814AS37_9BILA|nr:unnamed protein product [Adineta steineri]CAF0983058.1 unnamed protein product [Adineta steineri]
MMNSTTITTQTTITSSLTVIQNLITQYTFTIIFIIGNFSNLANILVFLEKTLRLNAYSWYFEFVSLGHLIFLYFRCLTSIITAWSGYDLTRTSIIYCRIRIYFLTISLLMARYFLCFISIDRWLIIFGLSFCILFSINFPIWYQIDGSKGGIGVPNTFYPLFYTIYNLVITIGPFFIMILFSLLLLRNLRQGHRRQVIARTQTNTVRLSINAGQQFHRKDIQFIKLSFIQVCLYILCNAFYGYNATYAFITQSTIKTAEQVAFNSFLSTIGLNINYLYMAITFFLYTLVSSTFRKECFLTIKRIVHYRFH